MTKIRLYKSSVDNLIKAIAVAKISGTAKRILSLVSRDLSKISPIARYLCICHHFRWMHEQMLLRIPSTPFYSTIYIHSRSCILYELLGFSEASIRVMRGAYQCAKYDKIVCCQPSFCVAPRFEAKANEDGGEN